ncbi:MAG: LamG-like jellyroll fold domain-containing protein, partial [Gelidibacter sp.]
MKTHYAFLLPFLFLTIFTGTSFGQSPQVRDAGKGESTSRGTNYQHWSNPEGITPSNTGSASVNLKDRKSHILKGSNYEFAIPTGATIEGIQIDILRAASSNGAHTIKDEIVSLVKQGSSLNFDIELFDEHWGNEAKTKTYGGSNELWGTTWTAEDINDLKFGAVYAVSSEKNLSAIIYNMKITVYFSEPATNDIDFNGKESYANFGNAFNFGSDFSMELWIKRQSSSTNKETLISKRGGNSNNLNNGYDLTLTGKKLTFNYTSGNIQAPQEIDNSRWYHVAVTYNLGTYRLYIDGILVAEKSGPKPVGNSHDAIFGAT